MGISRADIAELGITAAVERALMSRANEGLAPTQVRDLLAGPGLSGCWRQSDGLYPSGSEKARSSGERPLRLRESAMLMEKRITV